MPATLRQSEPAEALAIEYRPINRLVPLRPESSHAFEGAGGADRPRVHRPRGGRSFTWSLSRSGPALSLIYHTREIGRGVSRG